MGGEPLDHLLVLVVHDVDHLSLEAHQHLLSPDAGGLFHGEESAHSVSRVHQVVLGGHSEGGEVLQQVRRCSASWEDEEIIVDDDFFLVMIVHWCRSWMVGGSGFDFSLKMFSRQVSPGKSDRAQHRSRTEMMISVMMIMIIIINYLV